MPPARVSLSTALLRVAASWVQVGRARDARQSGKSNRVRSQITCAWRDSGHYSSGWPFEPHFLSRCKDFEAIRGIRGWRRITIRLGCSIEMSDLPPISRQQTFQREEEKT